MNSKSSSSKSGLATMEPITTTLFGAINTSFKLAEFGLRLADASEDNRFFCKLIDRVRRDRSEAVRERREKAFLLRTTPLKKAWIDTAIDDIDHALYEIGKLVESARIDGAQGRGITLKHRFEWVLKKKDAFLTKQSLLAVCHQSLSNTIAYMQGLPNGVGTVAATLYTNSDSSTATVGAVPPGYVSSPDLNSDPEPNPWTLQSPSARRSTMRLRRKPVEPEPQEESLPDYRTADSFSEDWERTMSSSSSVFSEQPRMPAWDEVSGIETLNAAAEAIVDLGGGGRVATQIADELRQRGALSVPNERSRRRRNEARFAAPSEVAGPVHEM